MGADGDRRNLSSRAIWLLVSFRLINSSTSHSRLVSGAAGELAPSGGTAFEVVDHARNERGRYGRVAGGGADKKLGNARGVGVLE